MRLSEFDPATYNKTSPMASNRSPTPMLDSFLQQVSSPDNTILPDWLEWVVGGVTFCVLVKHGFLGMICAGLAYQACHTLRERQIARRSALFRLEYERWQKVQRIQKIQHDKQLHRKVPELVLVALERAARARHDARESLNILAASEPAVALEMLKLIESAMFSACSVADPVILNDEQGKRVLRALEEDQNLMAQIVIRIDQEAARMHKIAPTLNWEGHQTHADLHERLSRAQEERSIAEAELNEMLPGNRSAAEL